MGVELQLIEPDDPAFERADDELRSRSQAALAELIEDRATIDEVRGRLTAARDRYRLYFARFRHLRLLGPIAPDVLGDANERLHDLTDTLGLDHDIADLVDLQGDTVGHPKILAVADARRADLQRQALEQGLGCYGEAPQAFVDRIDAYWNGARSTGVPIAV